MKTLIYYEKRKILRRKSTIIACLLMLLSIIALSFVFVSDQDYYRADGTEVSGMEAIHVKQEMDHALAGPLTAKRLKDTLQQYHTVYGNSDNFGTSGALKDEVYCKDILPYNGILNLMRRIYSPAGAYDMNILSSITNERVENFYQDRHAQVQSMRTRRNSVGLWLSDAELTHLRQQCQITGLNTNTYLRKLIMGEHLCPRPPDAYTALLRELSAIGNNINQIAHWTNGKGYATQAEIHEAVSLVKQAYRRILDTL